MNDRCENQRNQLEGPLDWANGRAQRARGAIPGHECIGAPGRGDDDQGKVKRVWSGAKDKVGQLREKITEFTRLASLNILSATVPVPLLVPVPVRSNKEEPRW